MHRYYYFEVKEDAARHFPGQRLCLVFGGIWGWVWTMRSLARRKNMVIGRENHGC